MDMAFQLKTLFSSSILLPFLEIFANRRLYLGAEQEGGKVEQISTCSVQFVACSLSRYSTHTFVRSLHQFNRPWQLNRKTNKKMLDFQVNCVHGYKPRRRS